MACTIPALRIHRISIALSFLNIILQIFSLMHSFFLIINKNSKQSQLEVRCSRSPTWPRSNTVAHRPKRLFDIRFRHYHHYFVCSLFHFHTVYLIRVSDLNLKDIVLVMFCVISGEVTWLSADHRSGKGRQCSYLWSRVISFSKGTVCKFLLRMEIKAGRKGNLRICLSTTGVNVMNSSNR